MKDLQYATVNTVVSSWDEFKRSSNYNEERLEALALLKLFELEPRTKRVFGLADDLATRLGPDTETLMEILDDLGKRHIKYGVKAQYYPFMGQAILHTISITMGSKWSAELENAWVEVFDELSSEMMKSTLSHREKQR